MLIRNEQPAIALDLREVDFIGSRSLGLLMEARSLIIEKDGRFVLGNLHAEIENVFELTHLNKVFEIEKDIEDLLEHSETILDNVDRFLDRKNKYQ